MRLKHKEVAYNLPVLLVIWTQLSPFQAGPLRWFPSGDTVGLLGTGPRAARITITLTRPLLSSSNLVYHFFSTAPPFGSFYIPSLEVVIQASITIWGKRLPSMG